MYIAPNSVIKLLKDVPIDSDYEHTLYFTSYTQQYNYFSSKCPVGFQFNNQTYTRPSQNKIRVRISSEQVYTCNYLMFRNLSHGNKWFYAFITKIDYMNDEVAEITFEMDLLQTYHFDYTLGECFVERQHVIDDIVGANVVPEKLPIGEYVNGVVTSNNRLENLAIIVACTFEYDYDVGTIIKDGTIGKNYNGVYGGTNYYAWKLKDFQLVSDFIKLVNQANAVDGILAVYLAPEILTSGTPIPKGYVRPDFSQEPVKYMTNIPKLNSKEKSPYNVPIKNNKLFTYPYNKLIVSNRSGDEREYAYELFSDSDTIKFETEGVAILPPQAMTSPVRYRNFDQTIIGIGIPDETDINHEESVLLSGWLMCSFGTDAFTGWLAQTFNRMKASVPIAGAVGAFSMAVGGPAGVLAGLGVPVANAVGGMLAGAVDKQFETPKYQNNQGGQVINTASKRMEFLYMNQHIRDETARIIDDYFTRFGYAVHKLTLPDRATRPEYTFVKTVGCAINGQIPSEDAKKISEIYDNGITWWKNPANVGKYSVYNGTGND